MKRTIFFSIATLFFLIAGYMLFFYSPLKSLDVPNTVAYHLTSQHMNELSEGQSIEIPYKQDNTQFQFVVSEWSEEDESLLSKDNKFRVDKVALTYPDTGEAHTLLVKTYVK